MTRRDHDEEDSEGGGKIKRANLRTVSNCGAELAKQYRLAINGRIDSADLGRYANALQIIARLIEGGDLEKRIEALEGKK